MVGIERDRVREKTVEASRLAGGKQDENSIVCYRGTSALGSSVTTALMVSAPLADGITYLIRKPISWNSVFPFRRLFVNYRCTSLWSLSPTIGYCLRTSFYASCLIQVRVVSNPWRHVGLSHFHLIADLFRTAATPRWGFMVDALLEHFLHSFEVYCSRKCIEL